MTEHAVTPQPPAKVRLRVDPVPGSRLETLLTELRLAKEAEAAAKDRATTAQDAVEAELHALRSPDSQPDAFDIPAHPKGAYPACSYSWVPEGWSLDSKALRAAEPAKWVQYAKKRAGYWTLKVKT